MENLFLTWANFKAQIVTKGRMRYFDRDEFYHVFYYDDIGVIQSTVLKDSGDDQTDFETNYKSFCNKRIDSISTPLPFSAKVLTCGKKLYKRAHGIQQACSSGSNDILFVVPYAACKITGVEILGGEHLDFCDLFVLDSTTGTYTGTPNYQLNQFGYSVNVVAGHYREQNSYDADLYINMQIKIVYNSQSSKTIGFNFDLHEVKA